MNLKGRDLVAQARIFLSEPSQDRVSDTALLAHGTMAMTQVMLDVEWPEATYSVVSDGISFAPGTELPLPPLTSILRVYVAGIACPPTSIDNLEGVSLGVYDNTGQSPMQGPQWHQAGFSGFPTGEAITTPDSPMVPFFQGQRPRYYVRGGTLGVIPTPIAGYKVAVDCYPAITPLQSLDSTTLFPPMFLETLAWRMCLYYYFTLGAEQSGNSVQVAKGMYEEGKQKLRLWKSRFVRSLPKPPAIVPHRAYMQGPYKGPTGG